MKNEGHVRQTAEARQLLDAVSARATHARIQVLTLLLQAQSPLSHQEVLKEIDQPIDRVTIYRVLEWLAEIGIAHKITADDRTFRFAVASAPHCHAHFHCENCHKVVCLAAMDLANTPEVPRGFSVISAEITLRGLCESCAAQK